MPSSCCVSIYHKHEWSILTQLYLSFGQYLIYCAKFYLIFKLHSCLFGGQTWAYFTTVKILAKAFKIHRKAVKQGQALWWAISYRIPTGQESLISLQFVDWPRVYQSDNFTGTAAKMSAYRKRKASADEKLLENVSI